MQLVVAGLVLLLIEAARLAGVLRDRDLDFGVPWFSLALPFLILGGLFIHRGTKRAAVVPAALSLFLVLNRGPLHLGSWTVAAVSVCAVLIIALGLKSRTPADDHKESWGIVVFVVVAASAVLLLYFLPLTRFAR